MTAPAPVEADLVELDFTPPCGAGEGTPDGACGDPATWVAHLNPVPCDHIEPVVLMCDPCHEEAVRLLRDGALCWCCSARIARCSVHWERLR